MTMTANTETGTQARGCRSVSGKVLGTLFFAVFFLMGALFTAFILSETIREAAVWLWPEVPCTVVSSGVEETGSDSAPYRPVIVFEYEIDGRSYRGTTLTRSDATSSRYDAARRPADRYPPGAQSTCRVHPDDPGRAVLERRLPWVGLVVFFPLIFVAIGGGGIYAIWKGTPKWQRPESMESISQRAPGVKNLGRKVELGMGIVFSLVGGGLSVFLLLFPMARLASALDWVEAPATVISSVVRSWSTDDGTSYRADVLYEYAAGGQRWRSNRRDFFPMSSSDSDDSRQVVDRYPEGSQIICYVDPGDPSRSVLERGFKPVYLIGLFPLVFLIAGVALTAHSLRRGQSAVPDHPATAVVVDAPVGERVLEPKTGPIAKIVGMVIIAGIWNGIVSVFVWQAVKGFSTGNPEWILTIFMIPFVLVGLGLIFGIFYTTLAAFNPRPRITVSPGSPRLGTTLRVSWEFTGRASRITKLDIGLEGFERASYRRGTDTQTDREAFASFEVVTTSSDWEILRGSAEVAIPEDTMHSFASANNAVVWSLHVHGTIHQWPDVNETFEIDVQPLARERLVPP